MCSVLNVGKKAFNQNPPLSFFFIFIFFLLFVKRCGGDPGQPFSFMSFSSRKGQGRKRVLVYGLLFLFENTTEGP